jgi:putative transposase
MFSRRVVGWAMRDTMPQELTLAALQMAITNSRPGPGVVHHSDRGSRGGFKWSSQHLDGGGCDEHSKATFGSVWAGAIVVTRSAAGGRTR